MKNTFLSVLLLSFNFCALSQNISSVIKIQAMDMAKSLIADDFNSFSKYIHPKIMEYAGGKEKLKTKMDSAALAMKQFGVSFKKILIGEPGKIIGYKKQLQCVLPQATDVQTIMGELHTETSLIAISPNNGKNWYFIDTNVYKADKLKTVLPELSPDLVIPPQLPPKFTPYNNNNE